MVSPCIVAIKENPVQILQRVFFLKKYTKVVQTEKKKGLENCQI
jgi:hypothetical protein